jgi:hypothetical protein
MSAYKDFNCFTVYEAGNCNPMLVIKASEVESKYTASIARAEKAEKRAEAYKALADALDNYFCSGQVDQHVGPLRKARALVAEIEEVGR